jgi:glycosyltransferase involved in cell wall biosynthesis
MKIFLLSDGPILKRDEHYWYLADTALKFFLENMAPYFDRVVLCVPVIQNESILNSQTSLISFDPKRIEIIETYPCRSVAEYYLKLPLILKQNLSLFYKAIESSDVIFLRLPAMNSFVIFFLNIIRKNKRPIVCYFEADEKEIVLRGNKYKGFLKRMTIYLAELHGFIYKKIARASKVSFFLSNALKSEYANSSENSFFIFTSLLKSSDIYRRTFDLHGPRKIILLYVGRLSHEKGLHYLLTGVRLLRTSGIDVKLRLCGDGPEKEKLQVLSRKLELEKDVEFLGFVPQGEILNETYMGGDIFVLTSLSEGVPKVLLEAMSKGLPIITTRVGGIPDIIIHNENGILIPPEDPTAIADAVKLLLSNDELRRTIVENGYKFISEHTAEKLAKLTAKMIHQAIV